MKVDPRIIKELGRARGHLFLTVLCAVLAGAAAVAQADVLSRTIAGVFLSGKTFGSVLPALFLFAGVSLFRWVLHWGAGSAAARLSEQIRGSLRRRLSERLTELGPAWTGKQRSGSLAATLSSGIDSLDAYLSQYLPQLAGAVLIPLLILLFVFPSDLLSGFVLLVTAPLIPVFMLLIGSLAEHLTRRQWHVLKRMSGYFFEVVQGLTTLKILGHSRDQVEAIRKISRQFSTRTMGVLRVAFLSALVLELVATISTAIIAVEVGLRLLYGKMAFQPALFILLLAPEFYQPLRQLGARFHSGLQGVAAAQDIFAILENRVAEPAKLSMPVFNGAPSIEFRNVNYRYQQREEPALRDFSLRIGSGERLALIGGSGAGKSTLISLLLQFTRPQKGEILVNGRLLREIEPNFWRQQIAWLPQQSWLFNETVEWNIRLGRPEATFREVKEAARLAVLDSFIESLPRGYKTGVGERGFRLSGGQAQRLALARAFLSQRPLLILDEPTSQLDAATEQQVAKSLQSFSAGRTVILITHQLGSILNVDRLAVLHRGRLVEAGSQEELIRRNGIFAGLVRAGEVP